MRLLSPLLVSCAIVLSLPTVGRAQRDLKDIPVPDPQLELDSFQVAEGFEVNLYASDPAIAKPIQMNFDAEGRLWIASSEVYPHIKPGQKANDKVLVVEDRDEDGVAETTRVFADGLLIPTGVEPGDGGVYVANSTELLHFRDTDGDGAADQRRIVLSGFGTEDTHHILHTLRWGPEGFLYFNQSIYIHSHIETPYGVKRLNGGGIWWFRPETMELAVYARGLVNPWGHQLDAYGQSFATDGAGGEGINFLVPGAAYPTAVGVSRILHGLNPGSPKHCGLEIVSGRHLPEDWQGSILTNDFRGHRVCRFVLSPDGSGFASREQEELIKTDHVAFRPIDIKLGPDGALYIADWYNPIIQHGEVDFRDPRRDHTHGRIWRVTCPGRPLVPRPHLTEATTRELLDHLKSPEGWTRHFAKRVLAEREDAELAEAVHEWVAEQNPQDPLQERHLLEALWVLQSARRPSPRLLKQALQAADPRVRAASTRIAGYWQAELPDILHLLGDAVRDAHPRVRLEAVRALGEVPHAQAVELAMQALDQPVDEFLDYALWLTARELRDIWLPRLQNGQLTFGGNTSHMAFAVQAVGAPGIASPLVDLLRSGRVPPDETDAVLKVIATLGTPEELRLVYDLAVDDQSAAEQRLIVLSSLVDVARARQLRPAGDLNGVRTLLDHPAPGLRALALEAVGLWQLEAAREDVVAIANDATQPPAVHEASVMALAGLGGPAAVDALQALALSDAWRETRTETIRALSDLDLQAAAALAVDVLQQPAATDDIALLIQSFIGRKDGPAVLAGVLNPKQLNSDAAKVALRTLSASGRQQPELMKIFTRAAGIQAGPKQLSPEELAALVDEVREHGDALAGERIFRRTDLTCLKCHSIAGAGGQVGPDLVSLGASAQIDYLIESLLDPNKKVKENYHTLVVVTSDGKLYTGIKVRQTDRHLVLRDAEDREVLVPLESIEEQAPGSSIMPAGLTEKLTRTEFVNLVRFLSELGKVGRFAIGQDRLVRRWRVMRDSDAARFQLRRVSYQAATSENPAFEWIPAYSTVDGTLPVEDVPEIHVPNRVADGHRGVGFVHFELHCTTPGLIELNWNVTEGLTLWLEDKPLELRDTMRLELTSGVHQFTVVVDQQTRRAPLRVELHDIPQSPAQVQPVSGK